MEKIFIKPQAQEILIKGATADGHSDIFSYTPDNNEQSRKLGHLFVVGHVQHESEDMGYVVNLIAALAKREYYANPDTTPKDAFASTLRKANEVVEEFFKNKGLKINIGIFTIAGEQINIAKIGKFKIFLARDNKTIDILNNVELFNKEKGEEREFSSIVSGAIKEHDRILAFYPNRGITAREKNIKDSFVKLAQAEFTEKLDGIKAGKDTFACTAVHINLQKVKEIALEPANVPVMEDTAKLASAERVIAKKSRASKVVATKEPASASEPVVVMKHLSREPEVASDEPLEEVPNIIPSEFSLGKKRSPFSSFFGSFRFNNLTPRNKAIISLSFVAAILVTSLIVKSVFVPSPQARELMSGLQEADSKFRLAKTKISQNDLAGARDLLASSILSVSGLPSEEKTEVMKGQLLTLLDDIDKASDVSPSAVFQVPTELGEARLISAINGTDEMWVYSYVNDQATGFLSSITHGSIGVSIPANEIQPSSIHIGETGGSIVDIGNRKIITVRDGKPVSSNFEADPSLVSLDLFNDNLYAVSNKGLSKTTDAAHGKGTPASWLQSTTSLPSEPLFVTVDGEIHVLTKTGLLVTYYKGTKKSELQTPVVPNGNMIFLSASESPNLFLVDRSLGRIYTLDKETGSLVKTLKIGNSEPIVSASVDEEGVIYFLTQDNRIWKVQ